MCHLQTALQCQVSAVIQQSLRATPARQVAEILVKKPSFLFKDITQAKQNRFLVIAYEQKKN